MLTAVPSIGNGFVENLRNVAFGRVVVHNDIDCSTWLSEINLTQYCETFLANVGVDGRILS